MKALICHAFGPIDQLRVEDMPDLVPGPGEVVLRVRAAGVNFPDALIVQNLYQFKPTPPFSPGGESAGEVLAVGEGVTRFKVGDAAIALTIWGGFAEQVRVREDQLFALPEGMPYEVAGALLLTYGTCLHALRDRANLQAGQTVLVLGAALGAASLMAGVSWMLWAIVAGVVAICALAAVLAVSIVKARDEAGGRRHRAPSAGATAPGAPPAADYERAPAPAGGEENVVFVSYARADLATVGPVVDELKAAGQSVWMDKEAIQPGEGWAGEIVRAIKAAERVCVMCSGAAFQSDHVKREVYLADRYRRPLTPVFLDDAPPPEDFEYFFAGLQHLKLADLPVDGRGVALAQVLGPR